MAVGVKAGDRLVPFPLVGHDPARTLGSLSQPLAVTKSIGLENQAIDFEIELLNCLDHLLAMGHRFFERVKAFHVGSRGQAEATNFIEEIAVTVTPDSFAMTAAMAEHSQPTLSTDSRVE